MIIIIVLWPLHVKEFVRCNSYLTDRQWSLLNLSSTTTSVIPSCSLVPHGYWLASSPGSHTGQAHSQGPRPPYWSGSFSGIQALSYWSGSHTQAYYGNCNRLGEGQRPLYRWVIVTEFPVMHYRMLVTEGSLQNVHWLCSSCVDVLV